MPTRLDVLPDDGDVVVAVGARVLVPEADDVAQLVHHDAEFVAVFADGDGLGAPSPAAHVGTAPGGEEPGDSQLSGGVWTSRCSPARSVGVPQNVGHMGFISDTGTSGILPR